MNYKEYFVLEPGKALCRQENCPKQLVLRKQGNTSGMRFHLRKYHPHLFEDASKPAVNVDDTTNNGLDASLSSLASNATYSFNPSNPITYETVNPLNDNEYSGYENNNVTQYSSSASALLNEEQNGSGSSTYDVKTEIMDMLFNPAAEANNSASYFIDVKNGGASPSSLKRPRLENASAVFELSDPNEPYYSLATSDDFLPSPSTAAAASATPSTTKKLRNQFTEADKIEMMRKIKRREYSLAPLSAPNDIMNFVSDGRERIAVFCTVCGAILSAKGGGSITYHRNSCTKQTNPTRSSGTKQTNPTPHPFYPEAKKKLHQKCLSIMTKSCLPAYCFADEGILDLLQYVHNLGFNYGVESVRGAKDDTNYGPSVISDSMPSSEELQRSIDETFENNYFKFVSFIRENIAEGGGGALTASRIDKYYHCLGYSFHFITKDWRLISIPIAMREYSQLPLPSNIKEDCQNLLAKFTISENDVTIVTNEESIKIKHHLQSAVNLLSLVVQFLLNPLDEALPISFDREAEAIFFRIRRLIDSIQDVFAYIKSKKLNFGIKLDDSIDNEEFSIIKQFLQISSKDFEGIWHNLKADNCQQFLQDLSQIQHGYHEVQAISDIVDPIATKIKTLEFKNVPSLYLVPNVMHSLAQNFNKIRNANDGLNSVLAESAYWAMEYVKKKLMADSHYIALFLNPKLNGQIENLIAQEALDKLLEKIDEECSTMQILDKPEPEEPTPKKFSSVRKRQRTETTFQAELDEYLAIEISEHDKSFEILDWWKQNSWKFPRLSKLAKKYLSIPSSADFGIQSFEILEKLADDERIATTPEMLTKILIYRSMKEFGFQ